MSRESAKSKDSCVGPAPFGISRVLRESSNKRVFAEFVLFTVCIVLLPCGLFFLSPVFLRGFLPEQSISVVSAVLSVILVNIICGIYVYRKRESGKTWVPHPLRYPKTQTPERPDKRWILARLQQNLKVAPHL
ncbi:hypothetical protein OIY81_1533 [Cryptosporidium canis]|nr:hypothetical protein OIY81_1533 [Cryptosporidium canis]